MLDDYSTHLVPQVNAALLKGGYIFAEIGGGITGNVQVNNLDLHSKLKIVSRSKNLWQNICVKILVKFLNRHETK